MASLYQFSDLRFNLANDQLGPKSEAKVIIEQWRRQYNTIRPHTPLSYRPPAPETIRRADLASTV